MAWVSTDELLSVHAADTGFTSQQGYQCNLTRTLQVMVDSPTDDANAVSQAPSVPPLASQASFGFGGPLLLVTKVRIQRDPKTRLRWVVTVTYEEPKRQKGDKNPDRDKENPLEWRDGVEWKPAKFTQPVFSATLVTDLPGFVAAGKSVVPMNAAGEKYDPPPERDASRGMLRITKRLAAFPNNIDLDFGDKINASDVSVSKPGFNLAFKAGHAKFEPLDGTLKYHITRAGVESFYVEVDVVLSISYVGWNVKLPNVGLCARALKGDPDGHGGTYADDPTLTGRPPMRRLLDAEGRPLSHPIPLDLKGQPLGPTADHTFIEYGGYDQADFSSINFNQDNQL